MTNVYSDSPSARAVRDLIDVVCDRAGGNPSGLRITVSDARSVRDEPQFGVVVDWHECGNAVSAMLGGDRLYARGATAEDALQTILATKTADLDDACSRADDAAVRARAWSETCRTVRSLHRPMSRARGFDYVRAVLIAALGEPATTDEVRWQWSWGDADGANRKGVRLHHHSSGDAFVYLYGPGSGPANILIVDDAAAPREAVDLVYVNFSNGVHVPLRSVLTAAHAVMAWARVATSPG